MKKLVIIFLSIVCLTACGKYEQEDFGNNYDPDKDAQIFSSERNTVYTENGFYTIADLERIDFIDKETGKQVPLCAKPDCTHEDESCNAYFRTPLVIQIYDKMLYVVAAGSGESTMSLYRLSMDGSERVEIKKLYSTEETDTEGCALSFVIHRGYGYMVTNWMQKDRRERTQILYRISLDSNDEKEKIYEYKGYVPLLYIIQGEKNRLYVTADRYLDQDLKEHETSSFYFDILKGTTTELPVPNGYGLIGEKDGELYYYKSDEKILYRMNEDGSGQNGMFEWQYSDMLIRRDSSYIYLDNTIAVYENDLPETEQKVIAIDYEGNVVRELADMQECGLVWSNGEQLLIRRNGSDGTAYELLDVK